jgi:hypothetical protein
MVARTLFLSWTLLLSTSAFAEEALVVASPEAPVATVLGEDIGRDVLVEAATEHFRQKLSPEEFSDWQRKSSDKQLVMTIRTPLIKAYAERNELEPTEAELKPTLDRMAESSRRLKAKRPDLAVPDESPAQAKFRREFVSASIRDYKVGEALWKEHGGSVGFGSLGSCMAFEGQKAFFQEEVEAARLVFHDPEIEKQFWRAIMDKQQLADVVHEDPKKISDFFDSILRRQTEE